MSQIKTAFFKATTKELQWFCSLRQSVTEKRPQSSQSEALQSPMSDQQGEDELMAAYNLSCRHNWGLWSAHLKVLCWTMSPNEVQSPKRIAAMLQCWVADSKCIKCPKTKHLLCKVRFSFLQKNKKDNLNKTKLDRLQILKKREQRLEEAGTKLINLNPFPLSPLLL